MERVKGKYGSPFGALVTLIVALILFFALASLSQTGNLMPLDKMVAEANTNLFQKLLWLLHDFTEPQFFAGVFPTLGLLLGAIISWRLDVSGKNKFGTEICYGSARMFPWVLASQVLSLVIAIFVLNYTKVFETGATFVPTFISVASVPPALMLLYGPSVPALLTGAILGGVIATPTGMLFGEITSFFALPGVIANVLTMAFTGMAVYSTAIHLPWMKQVPVPPLKNPVPPKDQEEKLEEVTSTKWFFKRVLADFSEAQFYGTELAGGLVLVGFILGIVFTDHIVDGAPVILIAGLLLSQLVGSLTGVFLYATDYATDGWAPTYIPVVSVGPACVLILGGGLSLMGVAVVAVLAGVIGGIFGVPVAKYLNTNLPDHIHITIGCVLSMAAVTALAYGVIKVLLLSLNIV